MPTWSATLTDRLLDTGRLDDTERIEIAGHTFYPSPSVVTRTNHRQLTYGPNNDEWVRNGDRWTITAGTRDELYMTNLDNNHHHTIPADYIAAGHVSVDYPSTINRAQGATVDEAHVIIDDRTNTKQLYVAATRGRHANHIHTAPPSFNPDTHGPVDRHDDCTTASADEAAVRREPDETSAIARRRRLRETPRPLQQRDALGVIRPRSAVTDEAAAAIRRLQQLQTTSTGRSRSR